MLIRLTIAIWVAATAVAAAEEPILLGQNYHPGRIKVVGCQQLANIEVESAVRNDPRVLAAGHPDTPLLDYVRTIQERVAEGLLHWGFPNAQVHLESLDLNTDRAQFLVNIQEGPRYYCGDIRVQGDLRINREELLKAIQHVHDRHRTSAIQLSQDEQDSGVGTQVPWIPGEPVPFDQTTREVITGAIKNAVRQQGFYRATTHIEILNQTDQKSQLDINVVDSGQPTRIRTVEVHGLQRNTSEAVLRLVDIHPGDRLDRTLWERCLKQLRESARFERRDMSVTDWNNPDGVCLQIKLVEYLGAPRLDEPFSREDEAVLKLRQWMVRANADDDWVLKLSQGNQVHHYILSPTRGLLVESSRTNAGPDSVPDTFALLSNSIAYYSATGRTFEIPGTSSAVDNLIRVLHQSDDSQRILIHCRFGFLTGDQQTVQNQFRLSLDPTAFLSLAHDFEPKYQWNGSELRINHDRGHVCVDGTTGALHSFEFHDPNDEWHCHLTVAPGAFSRQLTEARKRCGNRNEFDAQRPVTSIVKLLMSEEVDSLLSALNRQSTATEIEQNRHLFRAVAKIADTPVGKFLYPELDKTFTNSGLSIPVASSSNSSRSNWLDPVSLFVLSDSLFARNTWPSAVCRIHACAMVQDVASAAREVVAYKTAETDIGPLFLLVLTAGFGDGEDVEGKFTSLKSKVVRRELFVRECNVIFNTPFGRETILPSLIRLARTLSDDEAAALGGQLLNSPSAAVEFVRCLRRDPDDQSAIMNISSALERLWDAGLAEVISNRFDNLASRPVADSKR